MRVSLLIAQLVVWVYNGHTQATNPNYTQSTWNTVVPSISYTSSEIEANLNSQYGRYKFERSTNLGEGFYDRNGAPQMRNGFRIGSIKGRNGAVVNYIQYIKPGEATNTNQVDNNNHIESNINTKKLGRTRSRSRVVAKPIAANNGFETTLYSNEDFAQNTNGPHSFNYQQTDITTPPQFSEGIYVDPKGYLIVNNGFPNGRRKNRGRGRINSQRAHGPSAISLYAAADLPNDGKLFKSEMNNDNFKQTNFEGDAQVNGQIIYENNGQISYQTPAFRNPNFENIKTGEILYTNQGFDSSNGVSLHSNFKQNDNANVRFGSSLSQFDGQTFTKQNIDIANHPFDNVNRENFNGRFEASLNPYGENEFNKETSANRNVGSYLLNASFRGRYKNATANRGNVKYRNSNKDNSLKNSGDLSTSGPTEAKTTHFVEQHKSVSTSGGSESIINFYENPVNTQFKNIVGNDQNINSNSQNTELGVTGNSKSSYNKANIGSYDTNFRTQYESGGSHQILSNGGHLAEEYNGISSNRPNVDITVAKKTRFRQPSYSKQNENNTSNINSFRQPYSSVSAPGEDIFKSYQDHTNIHASSYAQGSTDNEQNSGISRDEGSQYKTTSPTGSTEASINPRVKNGRYLRPLFTNEQTDNGIIPSNGAEQNKNVYTDADIQNAIESYLKNTRILKPIIEITGNELTDTNNNDFGGQYQNNRNNEATEVSIVPRVKNIRPTESSNIISGNGLEISGQKTRGNIQVNNPYVQNGKRFDSPSFTNANINNGLRQSGASVFRGHYKSTPTRGSSQVSNQYSNNVRTLDSTLVSNEITGNALNEANNFRGQYQSMPIHNSIQVFDPYVQNVRPLDSTSKQIVKNGESVNFGGQFKIPSRGNIQVINAHLQNSRPMQSSYLIADNGATHVHRPDVIYVKNARVPESKNIGSEHFRSSSFRGRYRHRPSNPGIQNIANLYAKSPNLSVSPSKENNNNRYTESNGKGFEEELKSNDRNENDIYTHVKNSRHRGSSKTKGVEYNRSNYGENENINSLLSNNVRPDNVYNRPTLLNNNGFQQQSINPYGLNPQPQRPQLLKQYFGQDQAVSKPETFEQKYNSMSNNLENAPINPNRGHRRQKGTPRRRYRNRNAGLRIRFDPNYTNTNASQHENTDSNFRQRGVSKSKGRSRNRYTTSNNNNVAPDYKNRGNQDITNSIETNIIYDESPYIKESFTNAPTASSNVDYGKKNKNRSRRPNYNTNKNFEGSENVAQNNVPTMPSLQPDFDSESIRGGTNDIHKHFYIHVPPEEDEEVTTITPSEKHVKILFVKTPLPAHPTAPAFLVPSISKDKTIVYYLVKRPTLNPEIQVPTTITTGFGDPQVQYVSYRAKKDNTAANITSTSDFISAVSPSSTSITAGEGIFPSVSTSFVQHSTSA